MDICVKLSDITSNRALMSKKFPKDITPLSKMELLQFRQGISNCLFSGVTGICEDLALLPKEWYDEDVSCAFVDGECATGFFLVHMLPDGSVMPVLLFASGVDSKRNILNMLRYATLAASQKYEKDSSIIVRRHEDRTRKLAQYLFPEARGRAVNAGEREES